MPEPILLIAKCPVHGLHGERQDCFICSGPVEQVPMVPLPAYEAEVGKLAKALNQLRHEQFMNLHGLDGGAHSGRWENLGDTFQEAWRKAAERLWEILEAMRDA